MENLPAWLKERQPDIVCLQEIKCVDEAFPREPFEALGYNVAVHGQKTFNGVALLSKLPFDEVAPRPASATTATSRPASSRRSSRPRPACCGCVEPLSAQRQPAGHREICLQTQMDGSAY